MNVEQRIKELEQRVKELQIEHANISTQRIEFTAKENSLYHALEAAKTLLAFEQQVSGKTPIVQPTLPSVVEKESKTGAVLQAIGRRNGVTSQELHQAMTLAGMKLTRQHLYNTLARLKEDGRIEKRGEQYFVLS